MANTEMELEEPLEVEERQTPGNGLMELEYKYYSPALLEVHQDRRPKQATLCEYCKNAVWYQEGEALRAHCLVLFREVWAQGRESVIRACDGPMKNQEPDE
jgi:hypothetical protein